LLKTQESSFYAYVLSVYPLALKIPALQTKTFNSYLKTIACCLRVERQAFFGTDN